MSATAKGARGARRTRAEVYTLRKLQYHHIVPNGPYTRPRGWGGPLQLVFMRHPLSYLSKLVGWGGGGGRSGGRGGGVSGRVEAVLAASPERGGCAQPTTITCIPQGGIWGHGGMEVCMRS